jgi:hypothetical protein
MIDIPRSHKWLGKPRLEFFFSTNKKTEANIMTRFDELLSPAAASDLAEERG